jgi:hypothetical protein
MGVIKPDNSTVLVDDILKVDINSSFTERGKVGCSLEGDCSGSCYYWQIQCQLKEFAGSAISSSFQQTVL